MRAFTHVSAVALIMATVCSLSQAEVANKAKVDYWPMKEGNKWTYRLSLPDRMVEVVQRVAKVEQKESEDRGEIETVVGGEVVAREEISSTAKGVFRHSANGMALEPNFAILRFPFKKGEKREDEYTVAGEKATATIITDEDEVTVPAGTFKAITVEVDAEANGQKIYTKYWLAPNLGVVKQTFDIGGVLGTLELEKVELAK